MTIIPSEARTQTSQNGFSSVPKDLTEIPQWVFWRYVERDSGPTKVPYNPHSNRKADTTDPKTWGTFEQAVIAVTAYGGDGVGFVFSEDDTLAGGDLDDCIDPNTGVIDPDAQAVIDGLDSYTEVSPGGNGVKIFARGNLPGNRRVCTDTPWGGKVEFYDSGRFFTVTGQHFPGTPADVRDIQDALNVAYKQFFGSDNPSSKTSEGNASGISPLTDEGLIAEAERINGEKFRKLFYDGNISDYGDTGNARSALIGIVRWFANDDHDQIERIMRRSNLDHARDDEPRKGEPRLRYEIGRLTEIPLSNYYEIGGNIPPEFVSCHYRTPLDRKQNETGDDELVSCHGGGANDRKQNNLEFKSVQTIIEECGDEPDWIAHGFIARDWLTDLAGPAKKSGKTTLVMYLVRCILDGRPFLDYLTTKTNVVYLTEQASSVVEAIKKASLDKDNEGLSILQWKDTRDRSWTDLVEEVVQHAKDVDAGLIIVDTLNRFAGLKGEDENNAGAVAEVMAVLMAAAQEHNVAMLSIRHANKEGKARGSTQFDHDVDALFELQPYGGNGNENMRVLEGIGRSDDIPSKLSIELRDDGYHNLGSGDSVRFKMAVRAIREVVSTNAETPTHGPALLEKVRDEYGVAEKTGRRALAWLCDQGDLVRTGEGKRGEPHMFHMPPVQVREIKK